MASQQFNRGNEGVGASAANTRSGKQPAPLPATPSGTEDSCREASISFNVQQMPVRPSHGILGLAHAVPPNSSAETGSPTKRARKERGPNWSAVEIRALVEAKRVQLLNATNSTDGRELMTTDANKWQRVSMDVQKAAASSCVRDTSACKSKWSQMIPEYKRIANFIARCGTNDISYWSMSVVQKKKDGLPRSFPKDIFFLIHAWYGQQHAVTPPLAKDWLSTEHGDDDTPNAGPKDEVPMPFTDELDDEPVDLDFPTLDCNEMTASTHSPAPVVNPVRMQSATPVPSAAAASPSGPRRSKLPPGVTPHEISSSDTGDDCAPRKPANTGVKRKAVSGHALLAEATKLTGQALTGQMKDIAESSRDVEESKIELQQRLFDLQMKYQEDRDRRLQENARQTLLNAKLSIDKQGDVVQSLTQLTTIIGAGLQGLRMPSSAVSANADLEETARP